MIYEKRTMIWLYVISLFLLFGAFIRPKAQNIYIFMSFVILFVFAAFRDESVGTDTLNYKRIFLILQNGGKISQEIGWKWLNNLVIYFDGNFQDLLVVSTLLILMPIFYVSKKYSENPMFSIFLYYTFYIYLQSLNITRQSFAVSIVFLAIMFLIKKKHVAYVLLVLLAAFFHTTALLCLPLIFVHRIPDKENLYLISVIVSMFIGIFLFDYLLTKSASFLGYGHYLTFYEAGNFLGNTLFLLILNSFFVLILFTSENRTVFFKLFFLYIIFANLLARVPFGYRVLSYFAMSQVLFYPYYIYNNKFHKKELAGFLIAVFAYVIFTRSMGSGEIIPYINTLLKIKLY